MFRSVSVLVILVFTVLYAPAVFAEDEKSIPPSSLKADMANRKLLPANSLSVEQITATVRHQGYSNIAGIKFSDGFYHAEGKNKKGEQLALKIDTMSGRVLETKKIEVK